MRRPGIRLGQHNARHTWWCCSYRLAASVSCVLFSLRHALPKSQCVKGCHCIPAMQHAQVVVRDVSACFRSSAKRTELLKNCTQKADDTRISKKAFTTLCETRFIERHTTVVTLRQLLRIAVEALEIMKTWRTEDARKTANNLENAICKSDFVVVLEKVSGLMLSITPMLQAVQFDVVQAMALVCDLPGCPERHQDGSCILQVINGGYTYAARRSIRSRPRQAPHGFTIRL